MCRRLRFLIVFSLAFCVFSGNAVLAQSRSPVGWWKFDETSGTIAADSSGNGNDGTLVNGGTWVAGKYDGALQLDGDNQYVNLPTLGQIIPTLNECTFSVWLNWSGGANWQRFIDIGTGTANYIYFCAGDGTGALHIAIVAGNGVWDDVTYEDGLPENGWHHVAVTVSDSEATMIVYLDGQEVTTYEGLTNSVDDLGQTTNNWFGRSQYAADAYFNGIEDDLRIYNRVLSPQEVSDLFKGITTDPTATNPYPKNGLDDVSRDVVLNWKPGIFAVAHNLFLGTDFNDVNDATLADPLGTISAQGLDVNNFEPGRLEFSTTYYWRVDEVNAPANGYTYKGEVWSFMTEPIAYIVPSEDITASASSSYPGNDPSKTIDESGLDPANMDLHSNNQANMWLNSGQDANGVWIRYDFDKLYKLHEMMVWNYNFLLFISAGLKDVTIEYSPDGQTWIALPDVPEFARGTGQSAYMYGTVVDFNGVAAQSVRITANSNWSNGASNFYGLSEVRFTYIPVWATYPDPADGSEGFPVKNALKWRAGRDAGQHVVYVSEDEQAVTSGTAPSGTVTAPSYSPPAIDLNRTYYWRVDEVNNAETPSIWQGDTWSFTTQAYIVVENFEEYNDTPPYTIYNTWKDGLEVSTHGGSQMGNFSAPFAERTIVHSGSQSAPIFYDDTGANAKSEVAASTSDLAIGSDWSTGNPDTLILWFRGLEENPASEQIYVMLNGKKVVYPGDVTEITRTTWKKWEISLSAFTGLNLHNVTSMTVGVERAGATGGKGTLYVDDIQLTLAVPASDPGTANLTHSYTFDDGTARDSVGSADGTLAGGAAVVDGALVTTAQDQYMSMPGDALALDTYNEITLEAWYTPTAGANTGWTMLAYFGQTLGSNGRNFIFIAPAREDDTSRAAISTNTAGTDSGVAGPEYDDGFLHHIVTTIDAAQITLYIDGDLMGTTELASDNHISGVSESQAYLCRSGFTADPEWIGKIDEFNIYDRALSAGEVRYLYKN